MICVMLCPFSHISKNTLNEKDEMKSVIWSGLYAKYRSVWIPFISHAFADIAVFGIGAYLIFQAA